MPATKVKKTKKRLVELLSFDAEFLDEDTLIIGVDEVGRGCLAGPLCTGAFAYDLAAAKEIASKESLSILDDSKKLSATKRSDISSALRELELSHYSLDIAPVKKVDEAGIMTSIWQSMKKNIQEILISLPAHKKIPGAKSPLEALIPLKPYKKIVLLVDGPKMIPILEKQEITCYFQDLDVDFHAVVRGDSKSAAIAAASNVAKTARDAHMQRLARIFPGYAFESNVGYGTKAHRDAIAERGLSIAHRKTFCSNFVD